VTGLSPENFLAIGARVQTRVQVRVQTVGARSPWLRKSEKLPASCRNLASARPPCESAYEAPCESPCEVSGRIFRSSGPNTAEPAVAYQEVNALKQHERLVFTVREAAEVLGISKSHAYELVAQRVLPSLRLGRRIVIPRDALYRFLDGPAQPAA
jgi:excisionase family DNA binding protein